MMNCQKFYINGEWVNPIGTQVIDVINPANEEVNGKLILGSKEDVANAVIAADQAFLSFGKSSKSERMSILESVIVEYKKRYNDIADAIIAEMGAPKSLAYKAQAGAGIGHFSTALELLKNFESEEDRGYGTIVREPIGVCALITPWNWPINQITCKVAPALATGCTMVLKPSEIAPFSAHIFAEVLDSAGVPKGVFNLVHGNGEVVGTELSKHSLVDMVSFTGSTRAGSLVAQNAAPTIKRVSQELGGKSPNIILDDVEFEKSVAKGTKAILGNCGQSCNAPSRMFVPNDKLEIAEAVAAKVMGDVTIGDPLDDATQIGPVVSESQFGKIQRLIEDGIKEGAKLVCGGTGKPSGIENGFFVRPTVFSRANNQMKIAREEIFGPVLTIIPYDNLDHAVEMANDTPYGLAGYIHGVDQEKIKEVALKIRAGNININGVSGGLNTPFGGYKQSGNGREWGAFGFEEFLEIKAISGLGRE